MNCNQSRSKKSLEDIQMFSSFTGKPQKRKYSLPTKSKTSEILQAKELMDSLIEFNLETDGPKRKKSNKNISVYDQKNDIRLKLKKKTFNIKTEWDDSLHVNANDDDYLISKKPTDFSTVKNKNNAILRENETQNRSTEFDLHNKKSNFLLKSSLNTLDNNNPSGAMSLNPKDSNLMFTYYEEVINNSTRRNPTDNSEEIPSRRHINNDFDLNEEKSSDDDFCFFLKNVKEQKEYSIRKNDTKKKIMIRAVVEKKKVNEEKEEKESCFNEDEITLSHIQISDSTMNKGSALSESVRENKEFSLDGNKHQIQSYMEDDLEKQKSYEQKMMNNSNINPNFPRYPNMYNQNTNVDNQNNIMNQYLSQLCQMKSTKYHQTTMDEVNNFQQMQNNMYGYPNVMYNQNPNFNAAYYQYMNSQRGVGQQMKFVKQRPKISDVGLNYFNFSDDSLGKLSIFLIKEQNLCRYIQEKVQNSEVFANRHLFPNVIEHTLELSCDAFGNYLYQALMDKLTPENFRILFDKFMDNFLQISCSCYGTRVIQRLIRKICHCKEIYLKIFTEKLINYLLRLSTNQYGNHVVQEYLLLVNYNSNEPIYQIFYSNFIRVVTNKHGCCVIQKIFSEGTFEQKKRILRCIELNLKRILEDKFGNFIVQYIFNQKISMSDIMPILSQIGENLEHYCRAKNSSNALEKIFENASSDITSYLLDKLNETSWMIPELICDETANFVVQKALIAAKGELYLKMLKQISNTVNRLKKQKFGNKLIVRLLYAHPKLGNFICKNEFLFKPDSSKDKEDNNEKEKPEKKTLVLKMPNPEKENNTEEDFDVLTETTEIKDTNSEKIEKGEEKSWK